MISWRASYSTLSNTIVIAEDRYTFSFLFLVILIFFFSPRKGKNRFSRRRKMKNCSISRRAIRDFRFDSIRLAAGRLDRGAEYSSAMISALTTPHTVVICTNELISGLRPFCLLREMNSNPLRV